MTLQVYVVSAIAAAAVFSVAVLGTPKAEPCPDGCKCYRDWINCSYVGYEQPPGGLWNDIGTLWFIGNNVTRIGYTFFAEFPSLANIYLDENLITALDLEAFVEVVNLKKLRIRDNLIQEIIPLPAGTELEKLTELDLTNNSLLSIDSDVFLPFPALKTLYLNDNPLVIPKGGPLLSHPTLAFLYLARTNAAAVSAETFAQTPNLSELSLIASGVPRMAGAFRPLGSLTYLYLQDNLLSSVEAGQLPAGGRLRWLDVSRNPLLSLAPAALDGYIKAGYVYITDTPLACACLYEDLYRWAKQDKTWLTAYCAGTDNCGFAVV